MLASRTHDEMSPHTHVANVSGGTPRCSVFIGYCLLYRVGLSQESVSKHLCYPVNYRIVLFESRGGECATQEFSSRSVFFSAEGVDDAEGRLTIPEAHVPSTFLRLDRAHVDILQSFDGIDKKAIWPVADIVACSMSRGWIGYHAQGRSPYFSWQLWISRWMSPT